jgi:alpha-D-xyloside xylohydrolase
MATAGGAYQRGRWMRLLLLFVIGVATVAAGGPAGALTRQHDGVTIDFPPGKMKLQVCNDRIIRVVCTPGAEFSTRESLVVNRRWPRVKWTVAETPELVTIATDKMQARVSRKTGAIVFCDATGRAVARSGAWGFAPNTVGGQPTLSVRQNFDLPAGEAIYGLGQHQDGLLDQAGTEVQLLQVNTVACTPMLVSSRGYGVLWDNASLTRVNAGGNGELVPAASLLDAEGKPGGLTGEYFAGREFNEPRGKRFDPGVDFDWREGPIAGVGHNDFSARWTGEVVAGEGGDYAFTTRSDDGVRLWINDKLLIDSWTVHPLKPDTGRITLAAHSRNKIRLEYFQAGGEATVRLNWGGPKRNPQLSWWSDCGDQVDYYFMYGPRLDGVIDCYREATGRAPMYGKWALGFWQCKERYQTQQELLDIAEGYRSRGIPIDNIVQDWFYWDPHPWGSHEFDAKRYPDPAAAIWELHEKYKLHLMISVWGKFAPGSENFREMETAGYLYPSFGEPSRYYDAFNPAARELYWRQMKERLFGLGMDAWWLDATEPEVPMDRFREVKTALGPAGVNLNAWPLMTTTGVYEGQRKATLDKRVFILTRSVFAGQQRNAAATWSGDISATWDVFRKQVVGGLNFCASGVPYWTTDIGAFFGGDSNNPDYRELFVRWFQWGAFCPIFRVHGTGTNKELWRFGPENEKILVAYDSLRYRLMPYIYSLSWAVTSRNYTIMRALPFDFGADPTVLNIGDQFMFGPALMVSPVVEPKAASRKVYLPAGTRWYDFWTGKPTEGGQAIEVATPLETMPLHVRAGAILPLGPDVHYATEKPADPIELRVYPGANGEFTLYEDENDGYNYEKGVYATIPLRWNDRTRTLTIGERQGGFPGMLRERTFRISFALLAKDDVVVRYAGRKVAVTR